MTAPAPGTPEWVRLMTASKVAAVLGVSTYDSPRSLWHKMRGEVPWDDGHNADEKNRGHYLEAGLLAWWSDKHPEYGVVIPQHYSTRHDLPWAAATLDGKAVGPDDVVIVECKTSADPDEWGPPGTDVIPTEYLTQAYWQLALTPVAQRVHVVVLGAYLRFAEYVVERDDDIIADLIDRARVFVESLDADTPPALDDHVATHEVLKALNPDIEKRVAVELTAAEAREFVDAVAGTKAAEARERAARSVVLDRMGRAQYATHDGHKVARRQANRYGVSLVATATPDTLTTTQENAA